MFSPIKQGVSTWRKNEYYDIYVYSYIFSTCLFLNKILWLNKDKFSFKTLFIHDFFFYRKNRCFIPSQWNYLNDWLRSDGEPAAAVGMESSPDILSDQHDGDPDPVKHHPSQDSHPLVHGKSPNYLFQIYKLFAPVSYRDASRGIISD